MSPKNWQPRSEKREQKTHKRHGDGELCSAVIYLRCLHGGRLRTRLLGAAFRTCTQRSDLILAFDALAFLHSLEPAGALKGFGDPGEEEGPEEGVQDEAGPPGDDGNYSDRKFRAGLA